MKNNFAQLAQQHYAAYNVEQRGPGRRATREREEHVENVALTQSKFPTTIDIKFDIKNQESVLKEDALSKYQENCYLLGKLFSMGDQESSSESSDSQQEMEDDDTKALNEQLVCLQQEFIDQMKQHNSVQEQYLQKSDQYMALFNKVKTNMQREGCTQELLNECDQHIGRTLQPVFLALSEKEGPKTLWSPDSKLSVLNL